eukprot:2659814-Pleurochrysis_carterae.AAC.1
MKTLDRVRLDTCACVCHIVKERVASTSTSKGIDHQISVRALRASSSLQSLPMRPEWSGACLIFCRFLRSAAGCMMCKVP